jgi:hypothetical protein
MPSECRKQGTPVLYCAMTSIERAARAAIFWEGANAPEFLRDCADHLDKVGDFAGGEAVRDIADRAERLLKLSQHHLGTQKKPSTFY